MLICLWLKLPNQQNPTELNMVIFFRDDETWNYSASKSFSILSYSDSPLKDKVMGFSHIEIAAALIFVSSYHGTF